MTDLLTPSDVCRVLGISRSSVKRLTASGELPHVRVSVRRPRYRPEDVSIYINSKRKGHDS
jgi:excisionase family DNA binding protein